MSLELGKGAQARVLALISILECPTVEESLDSEAVYRRVRLQTLL